MLKILNFVKLKKKKKEKKVDEVYEFFVHSKPSVRKRAYEGALRMAQEDQLAVLRKTRLMK
jgi:hypothetical protein